MSTKDLLINTGLKLFAEKGFYATGIKDIITAGKIPKGSFYHYFESKEIFCLEVVNKLSENINIDIEKALNKSGESGLTKINEILNVIFGYNTNHGKLLLKLFVEFSGRNDYLKESVNLLVLNIIQIMSNIMEKETNINQTKDIAKYLFLCRLGVLSGELFENNNLNELHHLYLLESIVQS